MQIKKYRAADMHEALQKVKRELGTEAIILSTRQVRGGSGTFGLFGKPMLEVTAAREGADNPGEAKAFLASLAQRNTKPAPANALVPAGENGDGDMMRQLIGKTRIETQGMLGPLQDDISELREILQVVGDSQKNHLRDDAALTQIRSEISEMRNLLQSLSVSTAHGTAADFPDNLAALYQQLVFNGMEEKFARRLVEESLKNIPPKEMEDFSYVKIFLARMMMKIVRTTGGIQAGEGNRKLVALVGPTGVGKTTTVAKLASEQLLKHQRKVALITVDTFRIAAVEQLKVYAKIMGLPITVVQGRGELRKAIERHADADVIFIDTGGRSPRDDLHMAELYRLFEGEGGMDVYLTLSATTKDSDMTDVTRRFNEIPLAGMVFTKLDESATCGAIFNHAIRFKLPVAHLTTGQKVPEDIEVATPERLVDLLLNITGT